MNSEAIDIYLAEKLQTNITRIRPGEEMQIAGAVEDPFLKPGLFLDRVMASATAEKPMISCVNSAYYYGTVLFSGGSVFVGPVYSASGILLGNGLNFVLEGSAPALPEGSLCELLEAVRLLHNFWNDAALLFDELLYFSFYQEKLAKELNNRMNRILFRNNETNENHGSYSFERRLTHAIRSGDMKLVMEATMENVHGKHGTVDANALQNEKNLSIVGITIASRAAIEGGVHFEIVLSLTDSYLQQVSKAKTTGELETIVFQCNEHLTRLVSERRGQVRKAANKSAEYYSEKAKDYVGNHLHEVITVQNIADQLSVTPNYLSALFKKNEGIALSRYILEEKVSLAKSMLLYSTMSYSDIAMYLGFSSQSHFCKVFRQSTDLSPSEYRRRLT